MGTNDDFKMTRDQHDMVIAASDANIQSKRGKIVEAHARVKVLRKELGDKLSTFLSGGRTREEIHREEIQRQAANNHLLGRRAPRNHQSALDAIRDNRGGSVNVGWRVQRNRGAMVKPPSER